MDLIILIPLLVVMIIAALAAYGAWLIGQDSEAEQHARELFSDSTIASNGWFVLDWARVGDIPIVTAIEEYLQHLRDVVRRESDQGDRESEESADR